MALRLEDKQAIVADVNETAQSALSLVVADARGVDGGVRCEPDDAVDLVFNWIKDSNIHLKIFNHRIFRPDISMLISIRVHRISVGWCGWIGCRDMPFGSTPLLKLFLHQ